MPYSKALEPNLSATVILGIGQFRKTEQIAHKNISKLHKTSILKSPRKRVDEESWILM